MNNPISLTKYIIYRKTKKKDLSKIPNSHQAEGSSHVSSNEQQPNIYFIVEPQEKELGRNITIGSLLNDANMPNVSRGNGTDEYATITEYDLAERRYNEYSRPDGKKEKHGMIIGNSYDTTIGPERLEKVELADFEYNRLDGRKMRRGKIANDSYDCIGRYRLEEGNVQSDVTYNRLNATKDDGKLNKDNAYDSSAAYTKWKREQTDVEYSRLDGEKKVERNAVNGFDFQYSKI